MRRFVPLVVLGILTGAAITQLRAAGEPPVWAYAIPAPPPAGAAPAAPDTSPKQLPGSSLTFTFIYESGMTCTLSGSLQQLGQLYSVPNATYACSTGLSTSASMSEIKATNFGIEGSFSAPDVGGGCREGATFSAVFLPPI